MPRSRVGRCFSSHELARFLSELARTGNMTLAAAVIARPVRSLRDKKRRDPAFAARCNQALTLFQAGAARDGFTLQRGGPGGCVQLRRASPRALRPAALRRYLDNLAVTGNKSLAARSVRRTPQAMGRRRVRDPAFAAAEQQAHAMGAAALEAELVHSALAVLGEHGEADWLEDFGEAGEATDALAEPAFAMSTDDAMLLLLRHWRKQEQREERQVRDGPVLVREAPQPMDHAALVEQLAKKLAQFGRSVLDEEEAGAGRGGD